MRPAGHTSPAGGSAGNYQVALAFYPSALQHGGDVDQAVITEYR